MRGLEVLYDPPPMSEDDEMEYHSAPNDSGTSVALANDALLEKCRYICGVRCDTRFYRENQH